MGTLVRIAAAAAALAAVAVAASDSCRAQEVLAYAEERPTIDYDAFLLAVPQFKELSQDSLALAREVNEAMEALGAAAKGSAEEREGRAAVRALLLRYRDNKAKAVRVADTVLKTKPPRESDLAILKKLRETELVDVTWRKTKFIDCLRDLARAVEVNFVLHPDVLKFNTVEVTFPRASADGILRAIVGGFDCDWIVHDGEIVIIKSIKRNDKRLQQYLDKHPDWKFWRPEEVKEVEDDL
jgi:hypothetical protein